MARYGGREVSAPKTAEALHEYLRQEADLEASARMNANGGTTVEQWRQIFGCELERAALAVVEAAMEERVFDRVFTTANDRGKRGKRARWRPALPPPMMAPGRA